MKYSKPEKLTDPYSEWENSPDVLKRIIMVEATKLSLEDYKVIFCQYAPAADYKEGCYYFEYYLGYLEKTNEIYTSAYPNGLLWWIDHFQDNLKKDRIWEHCLGLLKCSIDNLLSKFGLFNLTEEECGENSLLYEYSIGPYNKYTVEDIFNDLAKYDSFQGVLNDVVDDLIYSNSISKIRWYVQLAYHTRTWLAECDNDTDISFYKQKEKLFHKLHSFKTYPEKADIAGEITAKEGHYKYNRLVLLL